MLEPLEAAVQMAEILQADMLDQTAEVDSTVDMAQAAEVARTAAAA